MLAISVVCWAALLHAAAAVIEVDPDSFSRLLRSEEHDVFVTFLRPRDASTKAVLGILDDIESRLAVGSGLKLAVWDVDAFGVPGGMHVHETPHFVLWPAGGRESSMYDWKEDDASYAAAGLKEGGGAAEAAKQAGGGKSKSAASAAVGADGHVHTDGHTCSHHGHDHGDHDHGHHHDHHNGDDHSTFSHGHHHDHHHHHAAPTPSLVGILKFLRSHATFGADVPQPRLADVWRGRDLFKALAQGLQAVHEQMGELQDDNARLVAENAKLKARVAALSEQLKAARQQQPPLAPPVP